VGKEKEETVNKSPNQGDRVSTMGGQEGQSNARGGRWKRGARL